jgi:hypothetical protein
LRRMGNAKNDRAKQRVIDAARETIFYHSPPSHRKTLVSSMPQEAQEQFRKLAVGQKLLQQRMEGTQEFREAVASRRVRCVRSVCSTGSATIRSGDTAKSLKTAPAAQCRCGA